MKKGYSRSQKLLSLALEKTATKAHKSESEKKKNIHIKEVSADVHKLLLKDSICSDDGELDQTRPTNEMEYLAEKENIKRNGVEKEVFNTENELYSIGTNNSIMQQSVEQKGNNKEYNIDQAVANEEQELTLDNISTSVTSEAAKHAVIVQMNVGTETNQGFSAPAEHEPHNILIDPPIFTTNDMTSLQEGGTISQIPTTTIRQINTIAVENNVTSEGGLAETAQSIFAEMYADKVPEISTSWDTDDNNITDMLLDLDCMNNSTENIIQAADLSLGIEIEVPFINMENGLKEGPPFKEMENDLKKGSHNTDHKQVSERKNESNTPQISENDSQNTDHDYAPPVRNKVARGKRKLAHQQRQRGESYIGYSRANNGNVTHDKPKPARTIKPRCNHTKPKKCNDQTFQCASVGDDTREKLFEQFWALPSWAAKAAYIKGSTNTRKPKRRRKESDVSWKQESHDCFLQNDEGANVRVCRSFFLATLCIGRDSFQRWVKNGLQEIEEDTDGDAVHSEDEVSVPDQPNMKTTHKVRRQHVVEWLDQVPKVPSHYCRASSQRVYVEATFRSVSHMYRIYSTWCIEHSYETVSRQIFATMLEEKKISIHSPRKDQCDTCCKYKVGQIDEQVYQAHREKQQEAREAKQKAKDSANQSKLVVTMDLQSVLLVPNIQASASYYKTKLQVHNFTLYSLNDEEVTLYVWDEANGGVGVNEFVSCITDFVEAQDYQHIVLISDGCGHQNRNKVLTSALSDLSQKKSIVIEQLILERGHTMMEADSVHSTLENIFVPPIYATSDYLAQMRMARPRKPYIIKALDYSFFKNYDSLPSNFKSIRPGIKPGDNTVTDIRALLYKPTGEVAYKLRHTEDYEDLPQRRRSVSMRDTTSRVTPLYQEPVPIKKEKYNHLQQLKTLIPSQYHHFYDSLSYN